MNFEKKVPDWENVGAEPDSELKKGGFKAGYKPPAAYFNWFFNRISVSVKELQNSLRALAFKDTVGDADITDVTAGKVKQDSTHRMITDTERTNWNDANTKKHTHSNKTVLDKVTQALLDNWSAAFSHVSNKSNPHGVTKSQVGLGNVDNTSDADKPVSTAQQSVLDTKVSASGGDIADTKVGSITTSTASYPVPVAGDTVKVGFGKITKFFTDIKNWMTGVCLIGSIVNNCVTNNAKLPLSAAQGKVLMDLYTVLNTKLTEHKKLIVENQMTEYGYFSRDACYESYKRVSLQLSFAITSQISGDGFLLYLSNLVQTIPPLIIPILCSNGATGILYPTTSGCYNIRTFAPFPVGSEVYIAVNIDIM